MHGEITLICNFWKVGAAEKVMKVCAAKGVPTLAKLTLSIPTVVPPWPTRLTVALLPIVA